jgi:hypothetical protein
VHTTGLWLLAVAGAQAVLADWLRGDCAVAAS